MLVKGCPVPEIYLPDAFADHFKDKIEKKVEESVYNVKQKLDCTNENFITRNEVMATLAATLDGS